MPSRSQITPLSRNKAPTADDFNIIAYILNGSYSNSRGAVTETTTRGLGVPVRLTGFDGRMATGLVDVASYALEVRNREATQQRALMVRTANNTAAFHVTGGKSYSPLNTGSSTSGQVLVNGSTAGGVLSGTYPDPTFYLAAESYIRRPKEIVLWWGSNATVLVAGNLELQDAPGWVLCGGQTVTMRAGGSVVTPNLNDKYVIGAGGTYALGATAGNALATQQAVSIAHGHSIAHTHSHDHAHEHTVQNHSHGLNSHTHNISSHTHDLASHFHDIGTHVHSMNNHSHTADGTLGAPAGSPSSTIGAGTIGSVTFSLSNHVHDVSGDTSGPSTANTAAPAGSPFSTVTGVTSSGHNTSDGSGTLTSGAPNTSITATDGTHSTTGKTSSVDASAASPATTSSQTTLTSINAQPPTIALWYIMKL